MTVHHVISKQGSAARLRVECVDSLDGFGALRPAWEALEKRDAEGTVFLSWAWLRQAFERTTGRWRVITAWVDQDLVAVLPLKYRVHWSKTRTEFQTEIEAGGRLLWSEYTGFLCDPAHEEMAITAIANHLQSLPWIKFSLRYVLSERRMKLFTRAFSQNTHRVRFKPYLINRGETDNLLCPQVQLPGSYDQYLSDCLSRNTRQKIKRFERKFLESGALTFAATTDHMRDIDALLMLWQTKWARVKGAETARQVARNYRQVLTAAQNLGLLYLSVLRDGDRMLGALGHVLDPQHKRMHFIVAGRDETAQGHHIGALLHSQSIRWAIDNGYGVYDFCHGSESYKYGYGAKDVQALYLSIRPKKLRDPGAHLDPLSHKEALARVLSFVEAGQSDRAAAGTRQLLEQLHKKDVRS
ncbi:GNAT family N-acetyltransferase [Tropicibacter sp. R16_0]|uniref:GNAT family N-acetyltransferase n=1 Tax=Tropicibacter sp. R16_0 TaxID=2821102 RepID=UPI001ADAE6E3|nr:GNAT family N-acetyltransferase [Tropicibacter sp. R16_0]MBO9451666.1 GNAT family N-acetyltransferase [Tropicibacter sp. R16_0]